MSRIGVGLRSTGDPQARKEPRWRNTCSSSISSPASPTPRWRSGSRRRSRRTSTTTGHCTRAARRERRAGRRQILTAAGPGARSSVRRRRCAGGHRRPVPGVQGVGRRLPDRRRGVGGARDRDRRAGLGRPRAGRRADPAADPRAAGHGGRGRRTPPRWRRTSSRRAAALNVSPRAEGLLRELAPQVLGVLARRRVTSTRPRTRCRRRSSRRRRTGRATASRRIHAAGWSSGDAAADRPAAQRAARRRREQDGAAAARRPTAEVRTDDDTLPVLFMCCHPALTPASAVALTLRAAGGLTTAEIARAFLVPEATMAQRISRAKQRIESSGVPFRLPADEERARAAARASCASCTSCSTRGTRRAAVATSSAPTLARRGDPAGAACVHRSLPDDAEAAGLLALMLLVDARRPARTTLHGELVPLAEQDRALWDRARIAEGRALLDGASARAALGEYQLQAAIAAVHDRAQRGGRHRLAADPRALRAARAAHRKPGRHAQPRGGDRDGARPGRGARGARLGEPSSSRATTGSMPCARTCSSSAATRRARASTTGQRRAGRRTLPSSATSPRRRHGSARR